ncbi:MAG: MmgE/PrpD family protein [Alphaproteobacteria bacterium]|nr:MmgE/PrpD family protein [Alphaproteobacteria bacterium]
MVLDGTRRTGSMGGMTDSAETILLGHVLVTPEAAIPEAAWDAARIFLLDGLAVGVAGMAHAARASLLAAARGWGAGEEARLWGDGALLPASQAAFVNAFQAHALEFDAIHEAAVVHAMTPTVSAALAEAERQSGLGQTVSGARFMAAVILGLDLACTIGAAARGPMRFFRPATAGMFGAYGAVARLRGFDLATASAGAGLLLGQLPGTMQAHAEGSMALPVQMGFAAMAGLRAADLAAAGAAGPAQWLTGPFGFLKLTEPKHDLAPGLAALGSNWQVTRLAHKPFPSGRLTHPAIDGAQRLMAAHGIAAGDVAAVRLYLPPLAMRLVGRPIKPDLTGNYVRLCLPYVVARTLLSGSVGLGDFSDALLRDPATHALAARVTLLGDGTTDENAVVPQRVEITLRDGKTLDQHVEAALGSPENPLPRAAQIAKVSACFAGILPEDRADVLIRAIEALHAAPDAASLGALLRG